jgi:hypothetical protein
MEFRIPVYFPWVPPAQMTTRAFIVTDRFPRRAVDSNRINIVKANIRAVAGSPQSVANERSQSRAELGSRRGRGDEKVCPLQVRITLLILRADRADIDGGFHLAAIKSTVSDQSPGQAAELPLTFGIIMCFILNSAWELSLAESSSGNGIPILLTSDSVLNKILLIPNSS